MKLSIENVFENYQSAIWWGGDLHKRLQLEYGGDSDVIQLNSCTTPDSWFNQLSTFVEECGDEYSEKLYMLTEIYYVFSRGIDYVEMLINLGGVVDKEEFKLLLFNHLTE